MHSNRPVGSVDGERKLPMKGLEPKRGRQSRTRSEGRAERRAAGSILIVTLRESIRKGEIFTVVVAARACGNVKNLSLLTGYTVGGRRPAVMNMFL